MASTTITFGVILTLLGLAGYFLAGGSSFTALIPSVIGLLLIVLGFLARSDAMRKHAMHAAAVVALVGCAGALFSLFRTPMATRSAMAVFSQAAMVVLTAVFLVLCIRSFKAARQRRTL